MSIEDLFTPASEYFNPDQKTRSIEQPGSPFAKTIIWYDQASPIFVCESHAPAIRSLEWKGSELVDNYDQVRREAYQRLFEKDPRCVVCEGRLGEILGLGGER